MADWLRWFLHIYLDESFRFYILGILWLQPTTGPFPLLSEWYFAADHTKGNTENREIKKNVEITDNEQTLKSHIP
jgi:hypothetical protein